ncbi:MAG TPA: CRISPR-associated endonuclease Cas6 [Candidatus Competibacteraceae bacterium]|nr:CRISPR-associated endonuclease Cas6 [Candidatus Competibacteraceae bacterium]
MHLLTKIPCAQVMLRWDRELNGSPETRARQLRGALAEAFSADDLFHQHDANGKPLYRYPLVQYRWQGGQGLVVGWGAAASRLLALPWLDLTLQLGEESVAVGDAALTLRCEPFGISEQLLHYRLVTPVLLLKSENYRRYQGLDERGQRAERDRLLVSNLLTAMRGLDIHFPVQLYAAFTRSRLRPCHYKGQELIGIDGEMACNAVLPEGLAIGHAVSHGFGWLVAG